MKFQMSLCILTVLSIAIFAGAVMAQPKQCDGKRIESSRPMSIMAWFGMSLKDSTPERFAELRNAGYTHHYRYYSSLKDVAQARKLLDIAQQADVKIFMTIPKTVELEEFINGVKDHKALAGYYVRDEPSTEMFDDLAKRVKAIQKLDNEHICYINLFPTYIEEHMKIPYTEHVSLFLEKVPVKLLSFDHYPVLKENGVLKVRPDFYRNLEIFRDASLKTGKPFWAFALTTGFSSYPVPTMAHLRFQVYSNLAYGATGIQHFTYFSPKPGPRPGRPDYPDSFYAPIDIKGKRTPVYDLVKRMNEETQALAGVFLGSKVVNVSHTGKTIPEGTKRYEAKAPFTRLQTIGEGAVVAELEQDDRRFVVVVNRDIQKPMTLNVSVDSLASVQSVDKAGRIIPLKGKVVTLTVAPGDIKIFTWSVLQNSSANR